MLVYSSKIIPIRNLFKNRIKTALTFISLNDDSVLLDIGCHSGHLLKMIREQNVHAKYFGIDTAKHKASWNMTNCDFKIADARKLPFRDKFFDIVFVLDVLEHIPEVEVVINEIKRVLKTNGLVILSGPTESKFYKFCRFLWLRKVSFDNHVYSVYDIEKKFLENGFMLIKQKSLPGFPIPEIFRISKFKNSNKD